MIPGMINLGISKASMQFVVRNRRFYSKALSHECRTLEYKCSKAGLKCFTKQYTMLQAWNLKQMQEIASLHTSFGAEKTHCLRANAVSDISTETAASIMLTAAGDI